MFRNFPCRYQSENVSSASLDGGFFFRKYFNKNNDIQVGLEIFQRSANFSDFIGTQELRIHSREEYFSIPIICYQKFSISNILEFSCGSGVVPSILNSQTYSERQGNALPVNYFDKKFGDYFKLSVMLDAPLYINFGKKNNSYLIIGNRFCFDLSGDAPNRYVSYGGFIGLSIGFNRLL